MSNSLRCYCASSILVRAALGMTVLTITDKFEFLWVKSTKRCSGPSKSPQLVENLELYEEQT